MAQFRNYGGPLKQKERRKFTEEEIADIEECAKYGMTDPQIAVMLKTSVSTLQQNKKLNKQFREALERGRATGQKGAGRALWGRVEMGKEKAVELYFKLTGRLMDVQPPNLNELGATVESHDGSKSEHLTVEHSDGNV